MVWLSQSPIRIWSVSLSRKPMTIFKLFSHIIVLIWIMSVCFLHKYNGYSIIYKNFYHPFTLPPYHLPNVASIVLIVFIHNYMYNYFTMTTYYYSSITFHQFIFSYNLTQIYTQIPPCLIPNYNYLLQTRLPHCLISIKSKWIPKTK